MSRRAYVPRIKKPTAQQQRELKEFKSRVEFLANNNLSMIQEGVYRRFEGHHFMIGNMECHFYPLDAHTIKVAINRFTTTRW